MYFWLTSPILSNLDLMSNNKRTSRTEIDLCVGGLRFIMIWRYISGQPELSAFVWHINLSILVLWHAVTTYFQECKTTGRRGQLAVDIMG